MDQEYTPYIHIPPEDKSGECETCGDWAGSLEHGMCPACREKYKPDEIARMAGV